MQEFPFSQQDLPKVETARLLIDYMHRSMMHHAMWYAEVREKLGPEKAFEALQTVYDRTYDIQMARLSKVLGFEFRDCIPEPMLDMPDEKLKELKKSLAINWLANDGIWFQAVEFVDGLEKAKMCNDACWEKFSPMEAWSVKKFLGLPENSGLEGLKKALQYRLYADVNKQSVTDETASSFVFRMNECRVQLARKRKGLQDYPCKSAGIIEYSTFAKAIDSRIKTECMACPPDPHPEEYFCAWRFSLKEEV